MKSHYLTVFSLLIAGCGMLKMPDITRETKEAVLETKSGQQLATALHLLHDDSTDDMAIRAAAAETVFMVAAEDRIHKYLGCALPLNIGTNPETNTPNVSLVLVKGDYGPDLDVPVNPGVAAPKSRRVYAFIEHAALVVLKDLAMAASKDLAPEKFNDYQSKAIRMIPIATAILGARAYSNSEKYYRDLEPATPKNARGETVTLTSAHLRMMGAKLLRTVAVKYSLPETDVNVLRMMVSQRLGIDYDKID